MKVKAFGVLSDHIKEEIEVETPISLDKLINALHEQYPALAKIDFQVAVNKVLQKDMSVLVSDEDEVALLPPFSGG
ncbi:MAG: MoaD/ThiS family protein [Weeksellaceae bacterium]|nr:MoaD/ThiS family protein [Weeksellaceae bacterium]